MASEEFARDVLRSGVRPSADPGRREDGPEVHGEPRLYALPRVGEPEPRAELTLRPFGPAPLEDEAATPLAEGVARGLEALPERPPVGRPLDGGVDRAAHVRDP